MKKLFILFLLAIVTVGVFAQDTITKRNGEEILAKVLNINDTEINYLKWNNQNGPTYTIAISNVFMIKYENGEKDVFGQEDAPAAQNPANTPTVLNLTEQLSQNNLKFIKQEDLFKKGKRFKRGGTAWMIISGIGMLGGCVVGGTQEWSTGAVVGFAVGGTLFMIAPGAILHAKGNKFIHEAEAMSVASLPLGELSFRKVGLSPGISVFSDRHSSAHALGIGASIHF